MTDKEKIEVLAAAVAGLLHEVGEDVVRMGVDGDVVGYVDGAIVVDGEFVAAGVKQPKITYFGAEEARP